MSLVINFSQAKAVLPSSGENRAGDPACDIRKLSLIAPFLKKRLETFFGLPLEITADGNGYVAAFPDAMGICNPGDAQEYKISGNGLNAEVAIAALFRRMTGVGKIIRKTDEAGVVTEFKYDRLRDRFCGEVPIANVTTLVPRAHAS